MSEHLHETFIPGCFRCDLSLDEVGEDGRVTIRAGDLRALAAAREENADDIRAKGWTVAVHNDYRQYDGPCTFWLFTHVESGRFIKGEGATDADALNQVRAALAREATDAG